ncbi:complement inhibitory receptor [Echinococcus multilocularis]|uniref:Complement inhibitory receptor n=1 Tax=Echinococcus multilocularis TaxID=6211 RepID=A0A068Y8W7_ECHMU|nr:complement inhibitory receptor [Echinococcus multilocularis]
MPDIFREDDQFRCCMYLHVRTGTVILGVLHILLQLVVVSTLLMAALKHDVATLKSPFDTVATTNCQPRSPPTDIFYMLMHVVPGFTIFHQSHSDFTSRFRAENISHREVFEAPQDSTKSDSLFNLLMGGTSNSPKDVKEETTVKGEAEPVLQNEAIKITTSKASPGPRCVDRRTNTYFSLCLALISLAFGYLLVHGVISRQPAHLLPFFCLQVFDFVVALICMLGYMSSASDISHWLRLKIASQEGVSTSSIHLNSTSVSLILISTSCLILAFKAYCIGMVWDCHRYLLITNRHGLLPDFSLSGISHFSLAPFFGRRPLLLIRRNRGDGSSGSGGRGGDGGPPDLTSVNGTAGVFVDAVPTEPPKDSALPKYEEALSIPANAFAPPPYFAPKLTEETKGGLPTTCPTTNTADAGVANVLASSEVGPFAWFNYFLDRLFSCELMNTLANAQTLLIFAPLLPFHSSRRLLPS